MADGIIGAYKGVPVTSIEDIIREFEKIGYTHEQAIKLTELAQQPIAIDASMDMDEIIDKLNSIPN